MIHNFPVPYPDELFYSVVARRERRMAYPSYKGVLREIFGCESPMAAVEFPSRLGFLMENLSPGHPCATFEGLEKLTLLPWYAPFLPPERTAKIRQAMRDVGGRDNWNRAGITASRITPLHHLRYCPECLRADKSADRIPYWRRLHQLTGVDVCPEHAVWLESSTILRLNRSYRYWLPSDELCESPSRSVADANLIGVAKLGADLLSRDWPLRNPQQLRNNYHVLLDRRSYLNHRGEVRFGFLVDEVRRFYPRDFLKRVGCLQHYWLEHMLRQRASIQQPIRHLILVNFLGVGLSGLFNPPPATQSAPVARLVLPCVNFLCPNHGKASSCFIKEEYMSLMGGMVEAYQCEVCGQIQGRCCVGHERTWVRDLGHLWRDRLVEQWKDPQLSLRAIAAGLRVSCDAVRKQALKLGLPLERRGRQLSVNSYSHLLVSKADRRARKVAAARKRWLVAMERCADRGMGYLHKRFASVYMILWRYDREWLKDHQPVRKARAATVDWKQRDETLSEKLKSAARSFPNMTRSQLAQAAGVTGWIEDRLSKLPNARGILDKLGGERLKFDFVLPSLNGLMPINHARVN